MEFVHTLCIADKLGILDSIEYITKQLHISSQPPPPRPVSFPKPRHVQPKFKSSKDIQAVPSGTQLHVPEGEIIGINFVSDRQLPLPMEKGSVMLIML